LCESLKRFGANIKDADISHDELDAITSALVGYFYLSGQYLGLGDERENDLIVPSIPAFDVKNGHSKVIAIAGETGSGKSTAALYLSLKYGFKSFRYSQVIAHLAKLEGKYDKEVLQEEGLRLHNELGQGQITLKLIENLPENAHVVIDGIRWVEDLHTLQEHFGNRLTAVMVECPDKIISRRLKKSPFFMGKTDTDIKKILTHKVESEIISLGFHIPIKFENTGSFKSYYQKLDTLVRDI
jgi:dephospho-CoA kinase